MSSKAILDNIKQTLDARMPAGGSAILFGSRARGDYRADSDWDILLILNRLDDDPLDGVSYSLRELGWSIGEEISPIAYTREEWEQSKITTFYQNVTAEGIKIYGS